MGSEYHNNCWQNRNEAIAEHELVAVSGRTEPIKKLFHSEVLQHFVKWSGSVFHRSQQFLMHWGRDIIYQSLVHSCATRCSHIIFSTRKIITVFRNLWLSGLTGSRWRSSASRMVSTPILLRYLKQSARVFLCVEYSNLGVIDSVLLHAFRKRCTGEPVNFFGW